MAKPKKQATPALDAVVAAGVAHEIHRYEHDPAHESFGMEAAEKLGVDSSRVFKTLVTAAEGELCVAVVPVDKQLDLKHLAAALKVKSVSMADISLAERTTGYIVGAISPLGQKKRLRTVIDASANALKTMNVSGGRRGLELEIAPDDLAKLTGADFAAIAR